MAYAKKTAKNEAYQKLKTDLKEGNPLGNAYLFYGEESYLREYYLGEIRKTLIPAGFEEFNYHALEGKDLTAQSLTEMAEAMPMMAERTLIVGHLQAERGSAGAVHRPAGGSAGILLHRVCVRYGGLQAEQDREEAVQGHGRPCDAH